MHVLVSSFVLILRKLGLKWDVIKMEIRSFTLQYSRKKARIERDKEKDLQIKMNNLQEKLSTSKYDHQLLNEYNAVKVQLDKILKKNQRDYFT